MRAIIQIIVNICSWYDVVVVVEFINYEDIEKEKKQSVPASLYIDTYLTISRNNTASSNAESADD
jgi:hypothetical protein